MNTRHQTVSSTGFALALEEEGSFAGTPDTGAQGIGTQGHTNVEKVGWVAFESTGGNLGTRNFEAGHTPEAVTHEDYTIQFSAPFAEKPRFFSRMASYYGTDSSQVRHRGVDTTSAVVHIEEENCSDAEQTHVREIVDWVAIEASDHVMLAKANFDLGCSGIHDPR